MIPELLETVGKNVQRRVFDCANSAAMDDRVTTTYHHARHNHARALFHAHSTHWFLYWRPVAPMQARLHNGLRLRNGWSAKTLRRISASINLITTQELFYAINMFGTCFDRN